MARRTYNNNHNLPSGYTELPWITSYLHRSAFKVTYTIGTTSGFVLRFHSYDGEQSTTAYNAICGVYRSGSVDTSIGRSQDSHATLAHIERIAGNYTGNFNLKWQASGPYIQQCSLLSNVATACDGTTQNNWQWNSNNTYATNVNVGIFAQYNGGTNEFLTGDGRGSVTIAYLALYLGTTLKYEFIPCMRNSDGKIGMYDKVNSVFHPSETSTDFVYP